MHVHRNVEATPKEGAVSITSWIPKLRTLFCVVKVNTHFVGGAAYSWL